MATLSARDERRGLFWILVVTFRVSVAAAGNELMCLRLQSARTREVRRGRRKC